MLLLHSFYSKSDFCTVCLWHAGMLACSLVCSWQMVFPTPWSVVRGTCTCITSNMTSLSLLEQRGSEHGTAPLISKKGPLLLEMTHECTHAPMYQCTDLGQNDRSGWIAGPNHLQVRVGTIEFCFECRLSDDIRGAGFLFFALCMTCTAAAATATTTATSLRGVPFDMRCATSYCVWRVCFRSTALTGVFWEPFFSFYANHMDMRPCNRSCSMDAWLPHRNPSKSPSSAW